MARSEAQANESVASDVNVAHLSTAGRLALDGFDYAVNLDAVVLTSIMDGPLV